MSIRASAIPSPAAPRPAVARLDSPSRRIARRFVRHRMALLGLVVLGLILVLAVFAPVVGRYDPNRGDLREIDLPPSLAHPLGTDGIGRDYFARLVYGARVSLSVGLVATSIAAAIGTLLGATSGYLGGPVDLVIQRVTEVVMTFPSLMLIITIVAFVGPSIYNVMLVLGLLNWTAFCRLVRGQVLALREMEYIEGARALGASSAEILIRHVVPNIFPYVIVYSTLSIAGAILAEAGLSFLGLGVQQPTPSWGNMLRAAQTIDILSTKPWRWMGPGIAIAVCVLAINFIGDGLRDAVDPRSQHSGPRSAQKAKRKT